MTRYIVLVTVFTFIPVVVFGYSDLIQRVHPDIPEQRANGISQAVKNYSDRYDVDPDLIISMMWHESDGFHNVKGPTGEAGYMQVKPGAVKEACGYTTTLNRLILDWEENIRCGIKYLVDKQKEHGWYGGISAYNLGYESNVNHDYVNEVLDYYQRFKTVRK